MEKRKKRFSLVIISYNQEKFISQSLLSALNQDYDNYEVIISDDCSTDNTWPIINEIVRNTTNIKSRDIILNRNDKNLGIVKNYQKALSLTTGEWIVGLAGDDIAKPNRLEVTNEVLLQNPNNIFAIGTGFDVINEKGKYISKNSSYMKSKIDLPLFPGFASSIHRKTFTDFPDIKENLQSEDIIYTLRALELGKIILINTSILLHRVHSNNVTSKGTSLEAYKGKIKNHQKAIETMEYYKNIEIRNKKLIPIINEEIRKSKAQIEQSNFIISFYRMNVFNKFCNLSKLKPLVNENKLYYTMFFKTKVLFESYKMTNFIFRNIMKNIIKIRSMREKTPSAKIFSI